MQLIEPLAAFCGLLGSLVLALNGKHAAWGWMLFMVSNVAWIIFSVNLGHWGLMLQQLGFLITSALGAWGWLVRPWWMRKRT